MSTPRRPIIVSTRNSHKAREIQYFLGTGYEVLTLASFPGSPRIVEDGETFESNATKKAVGLARWLRGEGALLESAIQTKSSQVLADDSGLEVDAIGGAPGVRSARFAADELQMEENCPDSDNNQKLLRMLEEAGEKRRSARFRCVLALARVAVSPAGTEPRESVVCFHGECLGRILTEPRGANGFGYDPLFVPVGFDQTFAELGDSIKNKISHRARALAKLATWLKTPH